MQDAEMEKRKKVAGEAAKKEITKYSHSLIQKEMNRS